MKNTEKYFKLFILISLGIIFLTLIFPGILGLFFHTPETRGAAGDMYGVLNTLFSGLAFAGVIITILMQMNELELSRKELELTRNEMERSALAQEGSQQALNNQLMNMKRASQIEAMVSYMQSHSKPEEYDQHEVSKRVLSSLVDELFYDDKYLKYVKPEITHLNQGWYNREDRTNYIIKQYEIIIGNFGATCAIVDEELNGTNYLTISRIFTEDGKRKYELLKGARTLERDKEYLLVFNIPEDDESFEIRATLKYIGYFIPNYWIQSISINKFMHDQGEVEFSDVTLIEKAEKPK